MRDREKRVIRPPKKYAYADLIAFELTAAHELDSDEPKTYSELLTEMIQENGRQLWMKICNH